MDRKKDNQNKDKKTINKLHITLALIAFIIMIVLLSPIKDKLQTLVGFKEKDLEKIGSLNLKWDEDIIAKNYKGNIIVDDKKTVTSYALNNKKLWSRNLEDGNEVYLGETGIFMGNEENKSISKVNKEGNDIWSYETENPVYTMTEIDEYLFVYSKVDENTRAVNVLDKDGKLILNKEKSKEEILSSNILDDKKQANEKKFAITSIDTSLPELKSKITYLSSNGETIWTEDVDEKVIYNILFIDQEKMLLISDRDIICKDSEGKTLWEREIKYNLKDVKIVDNKEILVLYGLETSYLEVLNVDGELDYKKTFKKEYNEIEEFNNGLLLMGKAGVVGLKNEKINMRNDISLEVKQIQKIEDEILIFTEDKIDIYKIVDKEKDKDKESKTNKIN